MVVVFYSLALNKIHALQPPSEPIISYILHLADKWQLKQLRARIPADTLPVENCCASSETALLLSRLLASARLIRYEERRDSQREREREREGGREREREEGRRTRKGIP